MYYWIKTTGNVYFTKKLFWGKLHKMRPHIIDTSQIIMGKFCHSPCLGPFSPEFPVFLTIKSLFKNLFNTIPLGKLPLSTAPIHQCFFMSREVVLCIIPWAFIYGILFIPIILHHPSYSFCSTQRNLGFCLRIGGPSWTMEDKNANS
jgi:hypothetical protein